MLLVGGGASDISFHFPKGEFCACADILVVIKAVIAINAQSTSGFALRMGRSITQVHGSLWHMCATLKHGVKTMRNVLFQACFSGFVQTRHGVVS